MKTNVQRMLKNKGLVRKGSELFKGNYEIAVIALKTGARNSFELVSIEKSLNDANELKQSLQGQGKAVRLLLKSKGNRYKAAYLSDFGGTICLSQGINRTLEINIKQLRDKLSPRKNARKDYSLEKSGFMGFGYNQSNSVFVCTRLYDTKEEASEYINKRYGVDKDTIEILDVSRKADGSFSFSKAAYDKMRRIKYVKLSKLIDKFGKEEAYAIMDELEAQRRQIEEETERARKIAKVLGVELEVDEQTELSNAYITNALNAIKEAQREISKNGLEILNAEDSLIKANDSLMNAKEHGVKAISKTIEAQRILENILKATNNNTEVEDIKIIEEL